MASETTGEVVHHVASYEGMPQLEFSAFPNQIFWMVVALLAIYFIIARVALPRIASVLQERHNVISDYLSQAEDFKSQAQEAEAAYETALAEARAEAQRIAAETKAEIQKDLDKAIAKADAEIAAKSAESEKAIAEISANALENVKEVATSTAGEILTALLPAAADDAAVAAAVAKRMKG